MRKNVLGPDKPQMTIWRMSVEYWVTKATNRHSEYVILIAFPLQQWLYECTSLLHCTYIASLVCNSCGFRDSYTNLCRADITQLVYSTLTVVLWRNMKVTKQSTKSRPINKWAMHHNYRFREYLLFSKMCCSKIAIVQCEWNWSCLELPESSDNT
jgi:hypothetical protein